MPIQRMNVYQAENQNVVWKNKWNALADLQRVFIPSYRNAIKAEALKRQPPIFSSISLAQDFRSKIIILRCLKSVGCNMNLVVGEMSLLDIILNDKDLYLISEAILHPSETTTKGRSLVLELVNRNDPKQLAALSKLPLFPKPQFNLAGTDNKTPLRHAIEDFHLESMRQLVTILDHEELRSNQTQAFLFASNDDLEEIQALRQAGIDLHQPSICILSDLDATVRELIVDEQTPTRFFRPTPETVLLRPAEIAHLKGHDAVWKFIGQPQEDLGSKSPSPKIIDEIVRQRKKAGLLSTELSLKVSRHQL